MPESRPVGQLGGSRRGTIRLLSTGPIHVQGDLDLTVGEPLEVMPVAEHEALKSEIARRLRMIEHARLGSAGAEPDDPYTGDTWYRAQLVQLREIAAFAGVPMPESQPVGLSERSRQHVEIGVYYRVSLTVEHAEKIVGRPWTHDSDDDDSWECDLEEAAKDRLPDLLDYATDDPDVEWRG